MSSRDRSRPTSRKRGREASENCETEREEIPNVTVTEDCEIEIEDIPNLQRERSEASENLEDMEAMVLRENVEEGNGDGDEETEKVDEDEEILGRYEYVIEEDVADFVDENYRERHTIPESSDEEEEDDFVFQKRRRMGKKGDALALGTTFWSVYQFKQAVLRYALRKGRNIKQGRWEKSKIAFICGDGKQCKWRVYCAYDRPRKKFVIKTTYTSHSCSRNGKCAILKGPVIAQIFMDKLRLKPDCMPEEIQSLIKENWRIVSSRDQCQRGRLLALKLLEKEYKEQFAHLRGYAEEIIFTNPGSTAIVDTYTNATGEDVFDRFYVCIARLKDVWKACCRPIIGLDGTFLKGAVKGVILSAVGHDANNQIYPIAWAVVQRENGPNWLWFVRQLKHDLELETGHGIVFISDRARGLLTAVRDELPSAEHRMCVKHIVENLKNNGHANKDLLKPLVWNLAWSYTKVEFEENRRKLYDYNVSLHDAVMKEKPETWCLAFYKLGSFCEDVDNNATESYNSTITKARARPLVPMLEMIRRQIMARITKRCKKSGKWQGKCSKYVKNTLESEKELADLCNSIPATHGVHEVFLHGNSYTVNTRNQTCSCGKYQITGIPCEHAYGAMINAGLDAEDYVAPLFCKEIWQLTYAENMHPVRGPRFWMKRSDRLVVEPPEPDLPGRKKKSKKIKKRIKGKHESPKKTRKQVQKLPRTGRVIHCSNCCEQGHNYLGCKINPKKKPRNFEETETETRQQASSSSQAQLHGSSQGPDMIPLTQPSQLSD